MSTAQPVRGLRRSVLESKSRKGGKGGWRGGKRDRHDISKASEEFILLTPAEYENPEDIDVRTKETGTAPYHTCQMHGLKLADSGPGSYFDVRCNLDAGDQNCVYCLRKSEGDTRVSLKSKYSFNIVHFGLYQRVPVIDTKTKRPVLIAEGENRGKPLMVWEIVSKPKARAEIMANLDERLLVTKDVALFRKKYVQVGSGHLDDLSTVDVEANKICTCGGKLRPLRFRCEKCDDVLADVVRDDMDDEMIVKFSTDRARCTCGNVGIPVCEFSCDDCKDPEPLTAFDVVARIRREGEGTNSHIVVKGVVPVDQFRLENGDSIIEWEEEKGKFYPKLDEKGHFVFTGEWDLKKVVTAQWNFDDIHTPHAHEDAARNLNCDNPYGASRRAPPRRYGEENRTRVEEAPPPPEREDDSRRRRRR